MMGRPSGRVQAVERALQILETVAESPKPLTLAEISVEVGLHASTTHHLLASLRARGFVVQDGRSGPYWLGPRALRLSRTAAATIDLRARLRPFLTTLASTTGETANLVVRDDLEAIYIDHVVGTKAVKLLTQIGQHVPLYCTAVGKALLAGVPASKLTLLLRRIHIRPHTPHTFTSRAKLLDALESIRANGVAVDREEHELGVACVAAPVHEPGGDTLAAIGISGPSGRVLAIVDRLCATVADCAAEASETLGFERAGSHKGRPSS